MFISDRAHQNISRIVQWLKGTSSRVLLQEFPHLKKQYWGRHLWARGYFAVTSGTITDENWDRRNAHVSVPTLFRSAVPIDPDQSFRLIPITHSGRSRSVVAALGASSYTWAEATWTQGLGDWIGSHTRAFVFFNGVAYASHSLDQLRALKLDGMADAFVQLQSQA